MKRILQSKSGMSMVLVLCCTALFMALGGVALSASSASLGIAHEQMSERIANFALESNKTILEEIVTTSNPITNALAAKIYDMTYNNQDKPIDAADRGAEKKYFIEGFDALLETSDDTMSAEFTIDPQKCVSDITPGIPAIPQIGVQGQREYRPAQDGTPAQNHVHVQFTITFKLTIDGKPNNFFVLCSYDGVKLQPMEKANKRGWTYDPDNPNDREYYLIQSTDETERYDWKNTAAEGDTPVYDYGRFSIEQYAKNLNFAETPIEPEESP